MNRLKTTAVIVEGENGTFLGCTRKYNHTLWGFPGGKTEEGESTIQCAIRELQEETGLRAISMNLLDIRDYDNTTVTPTSYDEVWLYRINSYSGELYSNEDLIARGEGIVGWITVDKLLSGPFSDYNRAILKKLYNYEASN